MKNAQKIQPEVFQKIAALEKQNKLYAQDIIVHVDNASVKLLDSQTFDVVEAFDFGKQYRRLQKIFTDKVKLFVANFLAEMAD